MNSLTLRIPVKTVSSNYNLDPPQFLLFIRKSELQEFFEKKKLPDNVNTFYAKYDSDAHVYNFTGLRTFINNIIEKMPMRKSFLYRCRCIAKRYLPVEVITIILTMRRR